MSDVQHSIQPLSPSERAERARVLFQERGYNCAQSVLGAFIDDDSPLAFETAMRLALPLGAGMGRLRDVCGAVSGMFLAVGLLTGSPLPDPVAKKESYALVQKLAARFREQTGSIVCRELLGLDHTSDPPTPEVRTSAYYAKRPCVAMVQLAATILQEHLAAEQ